MNPLSAHAWGRTPGKRVGLLACLLFVATVAHGQWQRVSVPTTSSLRGLSAVSKDIVWASGTGGTVIKTIDGGNNWKVGVVPGAESLDFRGIRAFDENNAVVISSGPAEKGQARIYRTVDGGKNWTMVFEEHRPGIFFDAIAFWDRDHGIVLSDPVDGRFVLFKTADGGKTWKQIDPAGIPAALQNEGAFAASNSCLTVHGSKEVWFATGGASVARVFRSHDRGDHWTVADTPFRPLNSSSGLFSLTFIDSWLGIAAGGDYAHPGASDLPNFLVTTDGGKSWDVRKTGNHQGFYVSGIAIPPTRSRNWLKAVIVAGSTGLYGSILTNVEHWNQLSPENLNAVCALEEEAWAVGANGMVLRQ